MAYLGQSGLGLPDREYYLKDDTAFTEIRSQYVEHIGRMLDLAGEDDALGQAQTILDLETQMAHRSGPGNLDSGLSEISIVSQAAVPKPVAPKYTTSGVRRPSEL